MNESDTKKIVECSFNSFFRPTGTSIENNIFDLHLSDIQSFKIKSCIIPISVYTFDSRNNKISLLEGATPKTITITPGFYNSTTIVVELQARFDALASLTYVVSYNNITNKITITSNSNTTFVATLNDSYYELGIASTDLNVASTSHAFDNNVDLSGLGCIYVFSSLKGVRLINSNYQALCCILINENSSEIAVFENGSDDYTFLRASDIDGLQFTFYDSRMRKITIEKDYIINLNFIVE